MNPLNVFLTACELRNFHLKCLTLYYFGTECCKNKQMLLLSCKDWRIAVFWKVFSLSFNSFFWQPMISSFRYSWNILIFMFVLSINSLNTFLFVIFLDPWISNLILVEEGITVEFVNLLKFSEVFFSLNCHW